MTIQEMKERKRELGYSYEQLAELAGIPCSTVQKIFGGTTRCPRRSTIESLERVLLPSAPAAEKEEIQREKALSEKYVSDRYLYGITIGYVTSIEQDSNNLTQTAHITPTVNFTDIKDVMVILDRKQEVNY